MRVSVAIPTTGFRDQERLARAIQSAKGAGYDEVVVSYDGSIGEASAFLERFPDIRLVRPAERLSMVSNWSKAFSAASGDVVHILCDDDLATNGSAERLRALFLNYPQCSMALGSPQFDLESGNAHMIAASDSVLSGRDALREMAAFRLHPGVVSNAAFRKCKVDPADFDTTLRYSADLELYRKVLGRGSLGILSKPIATTGRHDGQESNSTPLAVRVVENLEVGRRIRVDLETERQLYSSWFRELAMQLTIDVAVSGNRLLRRRSGGDLGIRSFLIDLMMMPTGIWKGLRHLKSRSWRSATGPAEAQSSD